MSLDTLNEMRMHSRGPTLLESLWQWLLRGMSVICIFSGLAYWTGLLGISAEGELRFDLVQSHWRLLTTVLAVVMPSAALGLWLGQAWGVVLWIVAITLEVLAYGLWTSLYAAKPMLVLLHAVCFGTLVFLAVALFLQRRALRQQGL